MYSLSAFICFSLMPSLSNSTSERKKFVSAIIPLAPAHETFGKPFRIITHSHTRCTAMFGFANDRISVISSFFKLFKAAAASSNAGIAASKSASASVFSLAMRAESLMSSSSLLDALDAFVSTSLVRLVILSNNSSHSVACCVTTTCASFSLVRIASTSVLA